MTVARMTTASREHRLGQRSKVADVLADDRTALYSCELEDLLVGSATSRPLVNRDDIVTARPELFSDEPRKHLVKQKPQEAACRARATRSAASAASSFRLIQSSMSALCAS